MHVSVAVGVRDGDCCAAPAGPSRRAGKNRVRVRRYERAVVLEPVRPHAVNRELSQCGWHVRETPPGGSDRVPQESGTYRSCVRCAERRLARALAVIWYEAWGPTVALIWMNSLPV